MENQLERYRLYIFVMLIIVFVLGSLVLVWRRAPESKPLQILSPSPTMPAVIKVYVNGAVRNAGVYVLQPNDRVEEAVKAAGGFGEDADLSRINLAARVRDEQHIYVPKAGESLPEIAGGVSDRININTASVAQLEALPGIGPVTAQKIVSYRQQRGAFKSVEELRETKLVGSATFEKIKDSLLVR